MNRKRSNGFTLIELLITIALMLSLLAGAIVSFIKISDAKKEEAYRLVKEQILTAGEQYFNSNIYLFEGMTEGTVGKISLGKLVSEDYLNKVTNPRTGKALSQCTYVVVKKENGRINAKELDSTDGNCDTDNSVSVIEPGMPAIKLTTHCNNASGLLKNNWCNANVTVKIEISKEGGDIRTIQRSYEGEGYDPTSFDLNDATTVKKEDIITQEMKNYKIEYTAMNEYGKKSTKSITLNIDKTAPTVTINAYKRGLDSNNNGIKADNNSKGSVTANNANKVVTLSTYINNYNGWLNKKEYPNGVYYVASIEDNYALYKANWKWNKTNLLLNSSELNNVHPDHTDGNSSDLNGTNVNKTIELSGQGYRKGWYTVTDEAGNETKVSIEAPIDRNGPTCGTATVAPTNSGKKTYKGWYNIETGAPNITLNAKDSLSGIGNTINQNVPYNSFTISEGKNVVYAHTFTDNAGNPSSCSESVSYDKASPNIPKSKVTVGNTANNNISSYNSDKAWVNKTTVWSDFIATDNGTYNSGIEKYQYKNSSSNTAHNLGSSYTYPNKNSTFYIRSVDNAGNTSAWSGAYNFKVDTTKPEVPSSRVTVGSTAKNNISSYNSAKTWVNKTTVWDNFSAEDNNSTKSGHGDANVKSGIAKYEWSTSSTATAGNSLGTDYTYKNKKETYYIRSVDNAGNKSDWSAAYNFMVDTTPPKPYVIDGCDAWNDSSNKDVTICDGGSYDKCYRLTRCGESGSVHWKSDSCTDNLSGVDDNNGKFLKWEIHDTSNSGYSAGSKDFKRFTNYYKNSNNRWVINSSADWMSQSDYNTRTGSDTYRLNFTGLSFSGSTYDIKYARKCKDRAGNWSKSVIIGITKGTGCSTSSAPSSCRNSNYH